MMSLWILFGLMALAAIGFAVWPLLRQKADQTVLVLGVVVWVVALSSGLYYYQGRPDLPSVSSDSENLPGLDDAVVALAERLEQEPDDAAGWMMLGRSYMSLGNYFGAVTAFERVVELQPQNAQALVSLGESKLASTNSVIEGEIAALFENALAIDPNNPQALFYGGIGAFNRGNQFLAASRWEQLLALNPPAEIQGVLQQRIAEWRGETPPAALPPQHPPVSGPADSQAAPVPSEPGPGAVVSVGISLSDEARAALPADATVFIIARDVNVPVPPIAVARRRLSELPLAVDLGDRESMVPGRELSGFPEFEVIARVSLSGQPSAASGDWFGSVVVKPADNNVAAVVIDQVVP